MSVNTIESENAQTVAHTQPSELIYRLEDRPPLAQTIFAALQHLLAMFVGVITPGLLICQALGLPAQDTQHIISMSLFASGVASIIQIKAWGPVGSGLLSIQGTSFNFVAPLIMGGTALKTGGADVPTMMAALFGSLMLASCTEMVISRILPFARRIITPLVSGVVVMIIGLSLIQVGLTSVGGGFGAMANHTFGAPKNLLLAGIVLAIIILLNRQRNPYLRIASLVIAMAVGYLVAMMMGLFPAVAAFVQQLPEPVLGGATLVMFGTIAASGVRIVSREPLNRRAIMIIALSLAVGLGVSQQPMILQFAPDWLKNLLSSGIAAGGITAIVLNLVFPTDKQ